MNSAIHINDFFPCFLGVNICMYEIFHLLSGSEVNSAFHTSAFDQISTRKSWGPNSKKKPIRKEEPWSFDKYVIIYPCFLSVLCSVYLRVLTYFICSILAYVKPFIVCDRINFVILCLWKDKCRLLQCLKFRIWYLLFLTFQFT